MNFLTAGPAPVTSPQITSGHCTKIPSDSLGRGLWGQGELLGVALMDTHGIGGQGDREIQVRDITETRKYHKKDSKGK